MYRWFLAVYFFSWLIVSGVKSTGPIYFIFLTNWCFIAFNLYLIVAAVSTTTKYLLVHFLRPTEGVLSKSEEFEIKKPSGFCGYSDNSIAWYQMIQWLLFNLAITLAFAVMILYWALLYGGGAVDGINANTHLVNGLVALVEVWVTGIPVNFLHLIYSMVFGVVYCVFTGIYFAATSEAVYPGVIDFGSNLGLAVGIQVGVVLGFLPLIHIIVFYLQYLARFWILYAIFFKREKSEEKPKEDEP